MIPPLDLAPGERRTGACPECGLEFSGGTVMAFQREALDDAELAERRRTMAAEMSERSRRTVERCDFSVYGLDERWTGSRWIGGSSETSDKLESLTLAFGDPAREGRSHPRVTSYRPCAPPTLDIRSLSRSLVQHHWRDGAPHDDAIRSTFQRYDDPTALWEHVELSVDGRRTAWKALGDARGWIAVAVLDGEAVGVQARAIDASAVGLSRVDDFEPYLVEMPLPD